MLGKRYRLAYARPIAQFAVGVARRAGAARLELAEDGGPVRVCNVALAATERRAELEAGIKQKIVAFLKEKI